MAKLLTITFLLFGVMAMIHAEAARKCDCYEEYSNDYTRYGNNNAYGNNGYGYGNNGYGVNNYGYRYPAQTNSGSYPYGYQYQRPVYTPGTYRNDGYPSYRYGRNQAFTQENASSDNTGRSNESTDNNQYSQAEKSASSAST